jgi:hypothetical protein
MILSAVQTVLFSDYLLSPTINYPLCLRTYPDHATHAADLLAVGSNGAKNAIFGFVGTADMCYKLFQKNIRQNVRFAASN